MVPTSKGFAHESCRQAQSIYTAGHSQPDRKEAFPYLGLGFLSFSRIWAATDAQQGLSARSLSPRVLCSSRGTRVVVEPRLHRADPGENRPCKLGRTTSSCSRAANAPLRGGAGAPTAAVSPSDCSSDQKPLLLLFGSLAEALSYLF